MTATIAMDPRIRARREEVEAEADRRRWSRFAAFAVLVGLAIAAAVSTRTPLLDVDAIEVQGITRTHADDVRRASGIAEGDPLTGVDLDSARESIAALPWVDTVTSHRSWAGKITFTITERKPAAQTVSADGSVVTIVDAEGRVLDVATTPRDDLVSVVGAQGSTVAGGWLASSALDAVTVAAAIPPSLAAKVDEVDVTPVGTIELLVEGVGGAVLGKSVELDEKFMALATMLDQVDLACVDVLDLQVPTVPVLTRKVSC
jgi:hypothetical protein